jgi:hypothetical protein
VQNLRFLKVLIAKELDSEMVHYIRGVMVPEDEGTKTLNC